MTGPRTRAFTLIELLVVISIILILVAAVVPVLNSIWQRADVLQCKNNMKQIGLWFIQEAISHRAYPDSSDRYSPGEWGTIHTILLRSLGSRDNTITACPSAKDSPLIPVWATCSYAYVGSPAVTFECRCSSCVTADAGMKRIWRWFFSGVQYQKDHSALINGRTEGTGGTDFIQLRGLPLADNVFFKLDSGTPTIPYHQDTDTFEDRERTYLDNRALRALPGTPADHRAGQPLVADILAFRTTSLNDLPEASDTSWTANEMAKYHTAGEITDENKVGMLYANHCTTSASSKKDWGINVFFSTGNVVWKSWDEIRFQVMVWERTTETWIYCYFF